MHPTSAPTALIVEGHAVYRDLLMEMLRDHGWSVDTAWNGVIGREKVRRHAFDLVLCSLTLPQHDEAETISRIRRQQADARIVALAAPTSLPGDPTLMMALHAGADAVLTKPFGIYDLRKALRAPSCRPAAATAVAEEVTSQDEIPVLEWAAS